MIWEALGATAIGLVIAYAAARRLPGRLPSGPLVISTGPAAALVGGLISRVVLGSGHTLTTLAVAAVVSVAILSLLVDGGGTARRLPPKVAGPPRV